MYTKIQPRKQLQPFIESIWIQENFAHSNSEYSDPTRVLPTTSLEATFFYSDPFVELLDDRIHYLPRSLITGQKTRFKEYISTGKTGLIIVRFQPWGAQPFFHFPLSELIDINIDLASLVCKRSVYTLENELRMIKTHSHRLDLVQDFLESLFDRKYFDNLVKLSALEIDRTNGTKSVNEIAQKFKLSKRQLERRFKKNIGMSPKKFSSIVRFQKAIQLKRKNRNWTDIAFHCDYYDQAHYIKEMKAFSGLAPKALGSHIKPTPLAAFFNRSQEVSPFYNTIYL